jgi:hypothetical protein
MLIHIWSLNFYLFIFNHWTLIFIHIWLLQLARPKQHFVCIMSLFHIYYAPNHHLFIYSFCEKAQKPIFFNNNKLKLRSHGCSSNCAEFMKMIRTEILFPSRPHALSPRGSSRCHASLRGRKYYFHPGPTWHHMSTPRRNSFSRLHLSLLSLLLPPFSFAPLQPKMVKTLLLFT